MRPGGPVLWLALAAFAPAFAQTVPGDAATVERLRQAALEVGAEAQDVAAGLDCPALGRLNIHAGARLANPALIDLRLRLDGKLLAQRAFSAAEADSLGRGGLYRLPCLNAATGEHRLSAEFHLRDSAAPAGAAPLSLVYDAVFDKAPQIADLVLEVDRANPLAAPQLVLSLWQPPRELPTPPGALRSLFGLRTRRLGGCLASDRTADPQLRDAQFLADQNGGFDAVAELLRTRAEDRVRAAAPEFDCELAAVALDYGALELAGAAYRRALAHGIAPATLVPLRVRLALAWYRRGEPARAAAELEQVRPEVEGTQLPQWQDAQSLVLLAQNRLEDAAALLQQIDNHGDYDSWVRAYNLAVALVRTGRAEQGAALLERIGTVSADSAELLALRDQANLALGYHFLRSRQGAAAIAAFQRVASQGPHANRALLGLGWAWAAPPGGAQDRTATGDEAARLKRALVAWTELQSRDARDPAVQEGLLAIGMALERLGAPADARGYYERGAAALDAAARELKAAAQYAAGRDWLDNLLARQPDAARQLPDAPAMFFLGGVIAGNGFQQSLRDGRDLAQLEARLRAAAPRMAELAHGYAADGARAEALRWRMVQLLPELVAAQEAQRQRMRALLLEDLEAQQKQNLKMAEQARLALARIYDGPPGGGGRPAEPVR